MRSIAIVGSGPMGLYLLQHLAQSSDALKIVVFEAGDIAGVGMPYDPYFNADYMLCNAFSREIPPINQTLLNWLRDQPARELSEWELSTHDLSARAFYPRVLIGEYMQSQFIELCELSRRRGHEIDIRIATRIEDICPGPQQSTITARCKDGTTASEHFDIIILATGHRWSENPQIDQVELLSPWPYTAVTEAPQRNFGILGSSLSAIDIVVALGHAHGTFDETGDQVQWIPHQADELVRVTMVSRQGIMPEADFYYPYPYEPLSHLTKHAVDAELQNGQDGLLDRMFNLLCHELDTADPTYLARFPIDARTIEGFADAYFFYRKDLGGLAAVKRDLAKARQSQRKRETIPHRYALLRAHEKFDLILRDLPDEDYQSFLDHLMPVFADCYAAVPHLSLARVVAMYDAGALKLLATAKDAHFTNDDTGLVTTETEEGLASFDILIDARGQTPEDLTDLPFAGIVKALSGSQCTVETPFKLEFREGFDASIYCLSLPQILVRYPFSQGLVECSAHAQAVANDVLAM